MKYIKNFKLITEGNAQDLISEVRKNEEFMNGTSLGQIPNNSPGQIRNITQLPGQLGQSYDKLTLNDIIVYLNNQRNPSLNMNCDKQEDGSTTIISFDVNHFRVSTSRSLGNRNQFEYSVTIDDEPIQCSREIGERIFGLLDIPNSLGPIGAGKRRDKKGKTNEEFFHIQPKEKNGLKLKGSLPDIIKGKKVEVRETYDIKADDRLSDIKRFLNYYGAATQMQNIPIDKIISDCNSVLGVVTRNSSEFLEELKLANRSWKKANTGNWTFPDDPDTFRFVYRGLKSKGSVIREGLSKADRIQAYDKWNSEEQHWQDDINYLVKRGWKRRNPVDTSKSIHKAMDKAFDEKFGIPLRSQSIFGSFEGYLMSDTYGYAFLLFPIGGYKVFWSSRIKDLFCYLRDHRTPIQKFINGEVNQTLLKSVINSYKEAHLSRIVNSNSEIMIHCDKYIAVNNMFRIPIEWYLRGKLNEFYQKLKEVNEKS